MKILICDYPSEMQRDLTYEKQMLRANLPQAEVVTAEYTTEAQFLQDMQGVTALITAFVPLTREVLTQLPELKIISVNATGMNTIDVMAAQELGIAVQNVQDYCTEEVATHTLALILALARRLKSYDQQVQVQHDWQMGPVQGLRRLSQCKLAVFGWGHIGQRVARYARALGMRILVVSSHLGRTEAVESGLALVDKATALREADIITNHMRQTAANTHYFDAAAFAAMQRHPVFINAGRGAAVDEAALVAALEAGQVSAAGLDVLASEEPDLAQCSLLGRDNVIITPHVAFYSEASMEELARRSCQHVIDYLRREV